MSAALPVMPHYNIVRLRGHHLLCMLTWKGVGYTDAFTTKFDWITDRLKAGASIEITGGIDDVCATLCPLTTPDYHCTNDSVAKRDALAIKVINRALGTVWQVGDKIALTSNQLDEMRECFKRGDLRPACTGCEWYSFCTQIADDDFAKTAFLNG